MRQIFGTIAEYEKSIKLRGARTAKESPYRAL